MRSIVIADGLTKEFLGTEQPFVSSPLNVGMPEVDRLLGRGKAYGQGPLPTFLRAAAETSNPSARPQVVLLRGAGPLPEILQPLAAGAAVVPKAADLIPSRALSETLAGGAPRDPAAAAAEGIPDRVLVIGCHTERHILALVSFLRHVVGCAQVAVSPHLLGSATQEAHFAALRHNFPTMGVEVLLDLEEAASYVGLSSGSTACFEWRPPQIAPPETRDALTPSHRRILEILCLNWTRADMRPLGGGFSGSLLLLANGWKGNARTEPLVLKVDGYTQMRRELGGYHQVKDYFGNHVPTFGYPVANGDAIGVGMELAAMEGRPRTLQATFEDADSDEGLTRFLRVLDKALTLLSTKLYRNTRETTWVVPYRAFGLHAEKQATYLARNATVILGYLSGDKPSAHSQPEAEQLGELLRLVARNPDGIESEVCLLHGDLNYANVIGDDAENVWFIDWTHSGYAPLEQDFAKLENDTKFVMSKAFDVEDLPRLRLLEEHLLERRIPEDANSLPDKLKFVKWDLRFRKMLETVRRVRTACFALKASEDWLVYKIALLRYATHTLSFDRRRGRGECDAPQLMYALHSVEMLLYDLMADDFHLKIRAERPASYPARQRVSIDEAPWAVDCPTYDPPEYTDAIVLQQDWRQVADGWADPADFALVRDLPRVRSARFKDPDGRPLNPRGRTGLIGRGLLGLWGPNLSVAGLVIRTNPHAGGLEILLGGREGASGLEVPKGFVLPDERAEAALRRVLVHETGWDPAESDIRVLLEGYVYDPRQTDHAWVETRAFLVLPGDAPPLPRPGGEFDELRWWTLDEETINRVPPEQARFVREAVSQLTQAGRMPQAAADRVLASTG